MDLVCEHCSSSFSVGDGQLPLGAASMQCPECSQDVPIAWPELSLEGDAAPGETPEPPGLQLDGDGSPSQVDGLELEDAEPLELDTDVQLSDPPDLQLDSGAQPPLEAPPDLRLDAGGPAATDAPPDLQFDGGALPALDASPDLGMPPPPDLGPGFDDDLGPIPEPTVAQVGVAEQAPAMQESSEAPGGGAASFEAPDLDLGSGGSGEPSPIRSSAVARPASDSGGASAAVPVSVRLAGQEPTLAEASGIPGRPRTVGVSRKRNVPWKLYLTLSSTVVSVVAVTGYFVFDTSPPPPPTWPNPLRERVEVWRKQGFTPGFQQQDEALEQAYRGLALGTATGWYEANRAVRSALFLDPGSAQNIALHGMVLVQSPDKVSADNLNEALSAITSAIGEDPDGPHRVALQVARAWLLHRAGKHKSAADAATAALELDPDATSAQLAHAVARINVRPSDSLAMLKKLAKQGKAPPSLPLWLGEAQLATGDLQAAIRTWQQAAEREEGGAIRRLARLYVDLGDLGKAIRQLQTLAERGVAAAEDRLLLARLLARSRRNPKAALAELDAGLASGTLSTLNRARLLCEKVAVAVNSPGKRKTNFETLSAWLDEALELAPDLPELNFIAGIADQQADERERALASLEVAQGLLPSRAEPAFHLAMALRVDEAQTAAQALREALGENPDYGPLQLLAALMALEAGSRMGAVDAVRKATAIEPEAYRERSLLAAFPDPPAPHLELAKQLSKYATSSIIMTGTALAYHWAGQPKQADRWIRRALKEDRNDVGARVYRASSGFRRGKVTRAMRSDVSAALQEDTLHTLARVYEARLLEGDKPSKAEGTYRQLLENNPLLIAARTGLARSLWRQDKRAEAKTEALRVLRMRPHDREALRFLAKPPAASNRRKRR